MLVCVDNSLLELIQYICTYAPKAFNHEKVVQQFMANTRASEREFDSRIARQRNQIVCDSVIFHFLCNAGAPLSLFTFEHTTLNEHGYSSDEDNGKYPLVSLTLLTSTITSRSHWPDGSTNNWVEPIPIQASAPTYANEPVHATAQEDLAKDLDPDEYGLTWRDMDGIWWRNYRCASLFTAVRLLNLGQSYQPLKQPDVAEASPLSGLLPLLDYWSECNRTAKEFNVVDFHARLKQQVLLKLPANKSLKNMLAVMLRKTAVWTSICRQLEAKQRVYTLAVFKLVIGVMPAYPNRSRPSLLANMLHGLDIGFYGGSLGVATSILRMTTLDDVVPDFVNHENKRRKF